MTIKEVLYDSEMLLRLVDSEIEELRSGQLSKGVITIFPLEPASYLGDSEQQAEAGSELHGPNRGP